MATAAPNRQMTLITRRSLRSTNEGNSVAQWETKYFFVRVGGGGMKQNLFDEIKQKRSVTKWPSHASGYIRAPVVFQPRHRKQLKLLV